MVTLLQGSLEVGKRIAVWVSHIRFRKPLYQMEQMPTVRKYGMTTIDAASTIVKSMELAASVLTQVHEQELSRQSFVEK